MTQSFLTFDELPVGSQVGLQTSDRGALLYGTAVPASPSSLVTNLGSFNTVATGAAGSGRLIDVPLATLASLSNGGALAFVLSVKDFWRWDPLSTLTPDNITVATPTAVVGAGRFIRMLIYAPEWRRQTAWTISSAGNDENDGATLTPLATTTEWSRRIGPPQPGDPIGVNMLVTIAATPPTDILSASLLVANAGIVTFKGTATVQTPAGSGAFTAVQAINRAGNLVTNVTDGARAWTRGQRIRITAGTPGNIGATAWITKDLTAGVAETTPFCVSPSSTVGTPTNVTPVVGDSYTVETVPIVKIGYVLCNSLGPFSLTQGNVYFDNLQLESSSTLLGTIDAATNIGPGISNCFLNAISVAGRGSIGAEIFASRHNGCTFIGRIFIFAGGQCNDSSFVITPGSNLSIDGDYLAADKTLLNVGINSIGGGCVVQLGNVACMRATTAAIVRNGAIVRQASLGAGAAFYGSGVGTGIAFSPGGQWAWNVLPTVATTVADMTFNTAATRPALDLAAVANPYTAARACTFALLNTTVAGGGFGGKLFDPQSGAAMIQI